MKQLIVKQLCHQMAAGDSLTLSLMLKTILLKQSSP